MDEQLDQTLAVADAGAARAIRHDLEAAIPGPVPGRLWRR